MVMLSSKWVRLGVGTLAAIVTAIPCGVASSAAAYADELPANLQTSINIADPDATDSAKALYAKLQDTEGRRIMFGHQQDLSNAVLGEESDVYALTGSYPMIFGQDTGTEKNPKTIIDEIKKADSLGGVMTLSSHWNNPATGNDYSDTTRVVDRLLPGGDLNTRFNENLDFIAQVAQGAVREDGTPIPIIYRPLHENDGGWFWWGAGNATNGEYIELYRYVVDYLRDVKKVHNLLYAYCGYTMDMYPGDDYVDIIGRDTYDNSTTLEASRDWIRQAVSEVATVVGWAEEHNKIAAFTEFGKAMYKDNASNVNPKWFTELLDALLNDPKASRIAYMMTWANWGEDQMWTPWPDTAIAEDFREFTENPQVEMASGLPIDYDASSVMVQNRDATVRFANPVERARITSDTVRLYAKVNGSTDVNKVYFTVGDDTTQREMRSEDIYYVADYPVDDALKTNALVTLHVYAQTGEGLLEGKTNVVFGEQPQRGLGVADDFDTYMDETDFKQTWAPNNADSSAFQLVESPAGTGKAMQINYDFNVSPGYMGVGRGFPSAEDWSAFDGMSLYVKSEGNGHKFVLQLSAGGVTFEAYPSLDAAVDGTLTIPFSEFSPASWESAEHQTATLDANLLRNISRFSIYLNDGDVEYTEPWSGGARPRSGTLIVDSIRCVNVAAEQARAALQAVIDQAAALNQNDYTAESWERLQTALQNAKRQLDDESSSIEMLQTAATQLQDAIKALQPVASDDEDEHGESVKDEEAINHATEDSGLARTGTAVTVVALAMLLLIAVGSIVALGRRRVRR